MIYSSSQIFPRTRGDGHSGNAISYDYQYEMATIPNGGIDNDLNVATLWALISWIMGPDKKYHHLESMNLIATTTIIIWIFEQYQYCINWLSFNKDYHWCIYKYYKIIFCISTMCCIWSQLKSLSNKICF